MERLNLGSWNKSGSGLILQSRKLTQETELLHLIDILPATWVDFVDIKDSVFWSTAALFGSLDKRLTGVGLRGMLRSTQKAHIAAPQLRATSRPF